MPAVASRHRTLWILLCALLFAGVTHADDERAWTNVEEHLYVVEIGGAVAGWMKVRVDEHKERYRTTTTSRLRIARGKAPIEIDMQTSFEETTGGVPVRLQFMQDMSQMKLRSEWVFRPGSVELRTRQGSRTITKRLPMPDEPWLTPMAVNRYWVERREAGAKEINYRMIDPEHGLEPIAVRSVLDGESTHRFGGRTVPVTVWRTTMSNLPGIEARELYSKDGHLARSEVDLGIGRIVTRYATSAEFKAADNAAAPEVMLTTFVKPDRRIPRAYEASSATFRVRARKGALPALPSAGAQRVEGAASGSATLVIDVDEPLAATDTELADETYLEASTFADAEDALIGALARRAVRHAGDDSARRAEAMRAFVYRYVTGKDLDTAFATASETAKLRTGDCSEHAVLLCAMLRAEDIPSRVATGLIYVDSFLGEQSVFGWHMWTQALIDGRWIDLDATLPRTYNAAHVLVSTSGMADGVASGEMSALLSLIGNIEIDVVDVRYD